MGHLNDLAIEISYINKKNGWYDEERSFGDFIALMHSELSEALEEFRNGRRPTEIYSNTLGKPEGIPTELADVIIRILDYCHSESIDIDQAIDIKMKYNESRGYKHGGKLI